MNKGHPDRSQPNETLWKRKVWGNHLAGRVAAVHVSTPTTNINTQTLLPPFLSHLFLLPYLHLYSLLPTPGTSANNEDNIPLAHYLTQYTTIDSKCT